MSLTTLMPWGLRYYAVAEQTGHGPRRRWFGWGHRWWPRHWWRHRRCSEHAEHFRAEHIAAWLAKRLKLDDEQRASLARLFEELAGARAELHQRRTLEKPELRALLAAPIFDQDQALELARKRLRALEENAAELINAFAAFHDSLDEHQRSKLLKLIERWR